MNNAHRSVLLATQNHCDWYELFEASYTPDLIFNLMSLITSFLILGGMGGWRWVHGICLMVGMITGGK